MTRLSLALLPILIASVAPGALAAAADKAAPVTFEVSAVPEKTEFMLGEPGYVLFKVVDKSDRDRRIMVGGDYRNRLGRPDSFKVEVIGSDFMKVPQPDAGARMGGIMHSEKLPAKGEYTFRLFLPHWATFEKPGKYTMIIRRKLELVPDNKVDAFRQQADVVEVATATTITIVPQDKAKLGKIIAELGEQMVDRKSDKAERAEQMMAAIQDERVIPWYVKLAEMPHSSPRLAACTPLGRFNNDMALAALQRLTKTTGADIRASATTLQLAESSADGVRHSAIHAIANSPHPKAIPLLWTCANDRNYAVRLTILHKASELKTAEARAIIEKMTMDENKDVRDEAQRYQKKLASEDAK
jgi:HEAT repeats